MKQLRACTLSLLLPVVLAVPAAAQPDPVPNPNFVKWARANAIPIPPVDAPYVDSSFNFLRRFIGSARILAIGEWLHWGHEPLAFRNSAIRYAVTHLGFTAVVLEAGFTPATIVDDFAQGGAGNIDSVLKNGLTTRFGELPENRELVLWLRAHNARARRKVHLYGMDPSGGASGSVQAALAYLEQVAPPTASGLKSRLQPMMSQLTTAGYNQSSPAEQDRMWAELDALYQTLRDDSSRYVRATSSRSYSRALQNAWMARRQYEGMAIAKNSQNPMATSDFYDATKFENVKWILDQEGAKSRIIVHAANAHVMNNVLEFPQGSTKELGAYLRPWFGKDVVILGAASHNKMVGFGPNDGVVADRVGKGSATDSTSFGAALAKVGLPNFFLDLRPAQRNPELAAELMRPWLFRTADPYRIKVGEATDAVVYFDEVHRTKGPVFSGRAGGI